MASNPEDLFRLGCEAFNERDFYNSHEQWEQLWTDQQLPDAEFIQGLIQLAVGCFHLTNANLNGARGLFTKCLPKLAPFEPTHRGLDVTGLVAFARLALGQVERLTNADRFDWSQTPVLNFAASATG